MKQYVYIFKIEYKNKTIFKVGQTNNVEKRMNQVSNTLPEKHVINLVVLWKNYSVCSDYNYDLEQFLKKCMLFDNQREGFYGKITQLKGEFFQYKHKKFKFLNELKHAYKYYQIQRPLLLKNS